MISEFDAATTPLENGFTIIEASAGTGKTTTISAIVLRLLIENGIPIEQILVTTYTELATTELRGRVRAVVADALATARGSKAKLPFVEAIVPKSGNRRSLEQRLERALHNFDEAPIFTIHGFCARVLGDRAFESGVLFDTELTADQSHFLNEVADDFWRINLYSGEPLLAALVRDKLSPAALVELLTELTNNPTMRVLPPPEDLAALKVRIAESWRELCHCWSKSEKEIHAYFSDLRWALRDHHKPEVVSARLAAAMECIGQSRSTGDISTCIEFFSAATLQANTRARGFTPQHAFFDRCEELAASTKRFVLSLQSTFCGWAREELRRRKADRRVQSFDDMLTQLDAALRNADGGDLQKTLVERFPVALIDEFQDTDPVQYSIFSQIYRDAHAPVFLIGDPKQAIYGFRGADVFTYLQAASVAARRYTLGKNWRSEAKLVKGVGEIFGRRKNAFVIDSIGLARVSAAGNADEEPLTISKRRDRPLRFWIVPAEDKQNIAAAVATEIARLLSGEARISGSAIVPKDIAVLVMTNAQPAPIRNALADLRIPSVVYSAASVFKSREAKELLRVLTAVSQPMRQKSVGSALATELFGRTAGDLQNLATDEAQWEQTLNRFARYHVLWRDRGFVEMMRELLVQEKVRARLLSLREGERRLTNVLHLIDLLHGACAENRFGMEGLISWLGQRISARGTTPYEYELRLETDDDAVAIVTIHKSKGLEFPITFCPFARKEPWRPKNEAGLKFHEDAELVLDLAKSEEHEEISDREQLAELVRQLYVGLTRAKHRSYVIWEERKKKSKAALAWLVSGRSEGSAENFVKQGESGTAEDVRAAFGESDAIAVEDLPADDGAVFAPLMSEQRELAPRIFTRDIDASWGIASFSSLISGETREPETADYDTTETVLETEPLAPAEGIHAFPGGTRAGTCIHKILEEIDFQNREQLRSLVSEKLAQFQISGFDDIVTDTLSGALEIPLGKNGFTLGQISARLPELEFTFPINALTPARLQKALKRSDLPLGIGQLQFDAVSGFLKGFVDLVFENDGKFYFADWKSNWLGPDASFYGHENLAGAMAENFYTLQSSIYALALHRYLAQRLPGYDYEKNFGGAVYIFLRGIDNATRGVFTWRPQLSFITKLDRVFHGTA